MDLIPRPDQVVSAAGNVAHKLLYGGVADLRPMPRTLIDEGELRQVFHYRPLPESSVGEDPAAEDAGNGPHTDPVLLVTPLAAPALCFDLRRGCSLVEHLVERGRPTYLVEYGTVSFRERHLGMEHWVEQVLPAAVRAVSAHAGGRPVHVVGGSLGGIFALLSAADDPDLPIASLSVLGAPTDVSLVPLVAPLRPLLGLTGGRGLVTRAYRAIGGAPQPLVRWAFQLTSFEKMVTKPLAVAVNLDDTDFLSQIEAVDRFTSQIVAYPGRTFGQLYHRFLKANMLAGGAMELGDRTIALSSIRVPVLVFAGADDGIAPVRAVQAVMPQLSGSPDARFEIVPGGHLGMLTGRGARTSTWAVLDDWFAEWSDRAPAPAPRRRARKSTGTKKAAAKKATAPKKATATKGATKKTATTKTAARKRSTTKKAGTKTAAKKAPSKATSKATTTTSAEAPTPIGTNPERRHGSGSSRALAR